MIISVSRRTDIPAFYSRWFFNRLEQGFVMVRNPMNPLLVRKIVLSPDHVDCIVFWTKNPRPMINELERLKPYHFYFLFTITSYGPDLEKNLPPKNEVIDTFIQLAQLIGKERLIWRYDPIILANKIDNNFHQRHFEYLANKLHPHTERCIISFLDMYKKCDRNLRGLNIKAPGSEDMVHLAGILNNISRHYGIELVSCAEEIELSSLGISHGKCIDDEWISRILGRRLVLKKDPHQRKTCRCVESIDIGAYDTCPHHCLYCYANTEIVNVKRNITLHDPFSSLLYGQLSGKEKIKEIF
ncbi:MAG: DUF1848 domain-containing protein [Acidobacteria bacterium]|nr:DUF1848 domain-containing protein [Acidobacteriota bacterium]